MSALGRLLRQSGIYALSGIATKAAGLLLLVLYLDPALLAQAEFGRLVLLETTANLLIVVAGLGLAQGLLRYATDPALAHDRGALAATTLAGSAVLGAATGAALALAGGPLAALLLDDPARAEVIGLLGLYVAFKVVAAVPYMALRVAERPGLYVLGVVVEFAVLVVGVYVALVVMEAGLVGVMAAWAASAGAAAVVLGAGLLMRQRGRVRWALLRPLLRFGAPLTFASLASVLLNSGDRYVLDAFEGAETVAVYGLAQKFGGLINMLFVHSFNLAFAVAGLKALGAGEEGRLHRRTFRHYGVLTGWGVLGVSVLALDVTEVLSPNPAYRDAEPLILPIALGFLALGLYYIVVNVLYAAERTRAVAGNVLAAAVANVALNVALIPVLGAMGAAVATLLSYAGLAAVTAAQARRTVRLDLGWHALAAVVLLVLGLWALAQPSAAWDPPLRLAWRLGLVALYPLLVAASGVYRRDELRALWVGARARWPGRSVDT